MKVTSKIIALPMRDVDTDLIIPADYLKGLSKDGLGEFLFKRLREADEDFPFNLPENQDREILVALNNFGCGSSREHAAWALNDWGIKVVIASSFADIFYNNALKNGVLPLKVNEEIAEQLMHEDEPITVDYEQQILVMPNGKSHKFEIDPYRKHCLINGMDDLDYLLSNIGEIKKYEVEHNKKLFFNVNAA